MCSTIGKVRSRSSRRFRSFVHAVLPVCLTVFVFVCGAAIAGIEGPLEILSPATTKLGHAEVRIGAAMSLDDRRLFDGDDADRTVYSLPIVDVAVGMSDNVELRLQYPLLFLELGGEPLKMGSGDLKINVIFDLLKETRTVPQCALMLGAKAPNASDAGGFGTDQTDLYAGAVLSRTYGDWTTLLNLSIGILDNPHLPNLSLCDEGELEDGTSQDDVLAYGLGAIYAKDRWSLGCEIHGLFNSRFGNDRTRVRGGVAYDTGRFIVDLGVGTGLTEDSGDFYVGFGISCHVKPKSF